MHNKWGPVVRKILLSTPNYSKEPYCMIFDRFESEILVIYLWPVVDFRSKTVRNKEAPSKTG